MAPVKNLKVVTKAFELPLVTSAYTEIATIASPLTPYVENTMTTITPMVEVGISTIKTTMEESVIPHLPEGMTETLQTNMTSAVEHVTAAVDKVDIFALGGLDQLVDNVPALKDATPELLETTKVNVTGYFNPATDYLASFSLAQVALKIVDSGLDIVEQGLELIGSDENVISSSVKKLHTTANTIRISGNKKAGTDLAKKIEEDSETVVEETNVAETEEVSVVVDSNVAEEGVGLAVATETKEAETVEVETVEAEAEEDD